MNLKKVLCNTANLISNIILDVFYPKRCIMCNSFVNIGKSISICNDCKKKLKDNSLVIRDNTKYFEETICSLEYKDAVKDAMTDFKFKSSVYLGKTFAWTVYENIKNREFLKDVSFICPVPLHPGRKREYNQSQIIAKEISKFTGIPVVSDVLIKTKNLNPLSKMDYNKRSYAVKSAFSVNPKYDVSGKTICLADDIYTTSATVNECSRILKIHGAKSVYALCPCYTPKKKGENNNANTNFANN